MMTRCPGRNIRVWALTKLGFEIGDDVYIGPNLTLTVGIADHSIRLYIGDRASLGPNVTLVLATHPNNSRLKDIIKQPPRVISIGHDSWLGANCVILPNVKIGNYCIIGAGAVVTHDVDDFSVVGGVPAKIIRRIDSSMTLS